MTGVQTCALPICVRVASDEDSSGTKRARLDNVNSNSGDDTTPSTSKEKKVLQFAVGYVRYLLASYDMQYH